MPESIGDQLLYAVSAWRRTSASAFARAVDEIATSTDLRRGTEPIWHLRRAAIQALDVLGHVDAYFAAEGGRVAAAPPVLAALPAAGLPRAVLCGARSPATAAEVRTLGRAGGVTVNVRAGASPYAPARIEVEASSAGAIADLAGTLKVAYAANAPAMAIAAASCSIDEYLESLSWSQESDLNWPRATFDPARVEFRAEVKPGRIQLVRYEDPIRGVPRFRLCRDGQCAWADPRWARYAVMRSAGISALDYEVARRRVLVPRAAPLPRLLGRALALCTGDVPRVERSETRVGVFEAYEGIPVDAFGVVASKLGVAN